MMFRRLRLALLALAALTLVGAGCLGSGGDSAQVSSAEPSGGANVSEGGGAKASGEGNATNETLKEDVTIEEELEWTQVRGPDHRNFVDGQNCVAIDLLPSHLNMTELSIRADWDPDGGTVGEARDELEVGVFNWPEAQWEMRENLAPPVNETFEAWDPEGEENSYVSVRFMPSQAPGFVKDLSLQVSVTLEWSRPADTPEPDPWTGRGSCT